MHIDKNDTNGIGQGFQFPFYSGKGTICRLHKNSADKVNQGRAETIAAGMDYTPPARRRGSVVGGPCNIRQHMDAIHHLLLAPGMVAHGKKMNAAPAQFFDK